MKLVYCEMILIDNEKAESKRLNMIEWHKLLLKQ